MTETYLRLDAVRPVRLSAAAPMSFVDSWDNGRTKFLVSGGETPYAIVLASGDQSDLAGSTWEQSQAGNWEGAEFASVELRVDITSFIQPGTGKPLLSLIRRADRAYIYTRPTHATGQRFTIEVADELPAGMGDREAVYSRWQIVYREGDKEQVLHTVDVTPNQTPAR